MDNFDLKDNISEITNSDIVEIIEHEYEFHLQSEEELQEEIELSTQEIEEIPEEIKVIHIDPQDYDGTAFNWAAVSHRHPQIKQTWDLFSS
jgi:galactose-1-phosphate uridylyltransferase